MILKPALVRTYNNTRAGFLIITLILILLEWICAFNIATDADDNYSPTRIAFNNRSVDAKKRRTSPQKEAELPAKAVPPIKGSSTISIFDLLSIVNSGFSYVLSDDVLSNLGVCHRRKQFCYIKVSYGRNDDFQNHFGILFMYVQIAVIACNDSCFQVFR
ncbi:MAG: hypothetical protein PUF72_06545 [Clostridiales bacterium]|nr:hypothetical protein [Clostridiales bacterium]